MAPPMAGRYVTPKDPATKRAAQIAGQIETDIIRRGWPVGESLGSEHHLQQAFGVSRSVAREAVRLVEHHQVARMRRGPGGGLVITAPDAGPATHAMVIYLEYLGITIDELLAARMLLEPLAAARAAERIDETGIDRLRVLLRQPSSVGAEGDLHISLAALTANPVLELFVDVLVRLTVRYGGDVDLPAESAVAEAVEKLAVDHAAIVDAVSAGDSARATTLTEHHVEMVSRWLARHRRGATRSRQGLGRRDGKRAEALASAIRDDIAALGWPVDTVFGTETELLARYEVSRSILREAVRLLEYHTVARMRRGPGGGLVVTAPQPDAIIDTVALYLEYRRPTREDLRLVRDAIEIANVVAVVGRREAADVAAFLAGQHSQEPAAASDFGLAGLAEYFFHAEISALAGNRVLSLFLQILVELFRRHWLSTMSDMPGAGDADEVHHAHARIISAIAAGDTSLAQHRSRRHLEALSSWWI